jgi:small subunit ribosomal protein S8
MPSSKIKVNLAKVLEKEGYIEGYSVEQTEPQPTLTVRLKYGPNRERVITGLRRISKPGLRVYVKRTEIPRVLGGLGVAILSTNEGLVTDRTARSRGLGGEIVAYVW